MVNTSVLTSARTQSILFVCYGSGHVRMVLPVARAMQARSGVTVQILGLSTAAVDVREAGLPLLQFKDFVEDGDAPALAHGRRLMADLSGVPRDVDETIAYLGLSYADLVAEHGEAEAARRYAERGRQAFLPVASLRRILQRVRPDLLVVTNSPRGERAAVIAAQSLGIPSVCMVDLFAIDEVQWIGQPGYAQCVCVLNPAVKAFLQASGRNAAEVVVTGNPAFDALNDSAVVSAGLALRRERVWGMKKVLLWPTQVEPAVHPFSDPFSDPFAADLTGDPSLPTRALQTLVDWVLSRDDCVLCVRPRAGEALPDMPALASALAIHDPRVVLTGQDWPLPTLLHATDVVVTLTSTVGLEGHLTGARVVQVLGSVFAHAMPMQAYGLCDAAVSVADLSAALAQCIKLPRRKLAAPGGGATAQVVAVLDGVMTAARAASSARTPPPIGANGANGSNSSSGPHRSTL